jgi:hypothetical protein
MCEPTHSNSHQAFEQVSCQRKTLTWSAKLLSTEGLRWQGLAGVKLTNVEKREKRRPS